MIRRIVLLVGIAVLFSCENKTQDSFTFSTWTTSGNVFNIKTWQKKINYYDSLGISEIILGATPKILKKIIPIAQKKTDFFLSY